MSIAELSVRIARTEIERDEALERAKRAEDLLRAFATKDEEAMLDTLHIIGIPARDLRDIYAVVQEWHLKGGNPTLLERFRERARLGDALRHLADIHHRTLDGSLMHRPEEQGWETCCCSSCQMVQATLEEVFGRV